MSTEITDTQFKKQIIFLLNNNWTGKSDMYFPLQNSINIERRYIFKLRNFNYIFYRKNTQETKRAILFLFLDKNGENRAVIILKDFTIYNLDLNCSHDYYYNSIFDISYTPEEICIYDTFFVSGKKINKYSFIDRISEAEVFKHNILHSEIPIVIAEYTSELKNIYNENENGTEVFMIPNDLPIITGVNYSCFKWKPSNLITFSLLVKEDQGDILLFSTIFKNEALFCKIHCSDPEGTEYINSIKNLEGYAPGCIIDVNVSDKMEILNVNTFKTLPSSLRSIEKIMTIKRENLSLNELDF